MKPYSQWSPTTFDTKALHIRNATYADASWLVAPCMRTRDSDALERANWNYQARLLMDAEHDTYEVLGFNHWACGWFEIMVVKPSSKAHTVLVVMEERLHDYAVLDEHMLSIEESEDEECEDNQDTEESRQSSVVNKSN